MTLPAIGTDWASRYPTLQQVAAVALQDLEPRSRVLPTLGERICAAMRAHGSPISAADIAKRIGTTADSVHAWLNRPLAPRDVRCVGKEKQRVGGKPAKLWVLQDQQGPQ